MLEDAVVEIIRTMEPELRIRSAHPAAGLETERIMSNKARSNRNKWFPALIAGASAFLLAAASSATADAGTTEVTVHPEKGLSEFHYYVIGGLSTLPSYGSLPGPDEVSVSWELISNTRSEAARAQARFVIRNNSEFTFSENNWKLYYNQRPARRLRSSRGSRPAEIEWLNGNWFRIVPLPGFKLGPGETVTIDYEAGAWWIKEADAPMGLYFVYLDDEGNERGIVTVDDYEIKPFVRPEQMTRHRDDPVPLNTPEFRYRDAGGLRLLPGDETHRFVPTPVRLEGGGEFVLFEDPLKIFYDDGLQNEAVHLARVLRELTGYDASLRQGDGAGPNTIRLARTPFAVNGVEEEAYRLRVERDASIVIEGSDPAGVFYGVQTLIGLLPLDLLLGESRELTMEVLTIEDAPRFAYRGLLVDVARNFQTPATIRKVLDVMAYYKLNVLHFYLTDDEGWRIEIESLPELTAVGGQREHTTVDAPKLHPSYGSGPFPYAEGTYGSGYYTRAEFIDILRYAHERHIQVVPSINLPAHARAAIKSMEARYERLMAEGDEEAANEFRLIDPDDKSEFASPQSYTDNVVNVAMESVYRFFDTVIDELSAAYEEAGVPFTMVHTGGDEVAVGAWTASPIAAELLAKMPEISDPQNLQAYFSKRTLAKLRERNLKVGGWEEVAQVRDERGRFVPNPEFAGGDIVTYVWRNQGNLRDLAYRLANMGYPVILCHRSNFYFDLAYNNHPEEPGHYSAGFISTRDAWQYAPYNIFLTTLRTRRGHSIDVEREFQDMEGLEPEARKNILGLQAQVWTEVVFGADGMEYYLLPRLAGFAESAWAPERAFETIADRAEREREMDRGWNLFANTLARKELPRLAVLFGGFGYRVPPPGAMIEDGRLKANVKYPGLDIYYTINGEDPTLDSIKYTGPVEVDEPVKLKAFDRAGRHSRAIAVE